MMTIKPVRTKHDYERTLREIDKLMDARANTRRGDLLDVLVTLVEAYERTHYRIGPPDPIEAIKYRMEQLHLKPTDLAPYLGGKNRVSEVLRGKRKLTVTMMKALHRHLNISAESLLGA
jgi:HTH-type transcriptional regulator / antitoxin HigA